MTEQLTLDFMEDLHKQQVIQWYKSRNPQPGWIVCPTCYVFHIPDYLEECWWCSHTEEPRWDLYIAN